MKPLVRSLTTVAFILSLIAGSHTVVFAGVSGAESGSLAAGGQNSKRALASLCPSQLPHRIWLPLIIGGTDAAYANSIDTSGGWRLPLDGAAVISDGPGEDFHVNRSAEAVDYGINGQSFPVLAPADGVVLDVLHDNQSTFGWVVRVNHNNLYSFFAHVDGDSVPARIFVQAGQRVTQGQCIAMSSNSGVPTEGIHLHFEARMGAVAGNIFSGQSVPIREIPGHWWNPWYAPPPDFQHDAYLFSGGAQYPESRTPPSTMGSPSVRHLADVTAPPSALNSYVTNITGQSPAGTITLHLAASPNSPVATIVPADAYHTLFEVDK